MPPLVRQASTVAFEEFATIMRRTSRVNELSCHGCVRAPALPAFAAFRRHGLRQCSKAAMTGGYLSAEGDAGMAQAEVGPARSADMTFAGRKLNIYPSAMRLVNPVSTARE